ncbi:MAG: translation elongation factor Ts [Candidatus Hydrogenedentes bacterium]|nr:translation elongation factor Ts [Candidatus Hydrogenedentota bacterium]
MEISASRVKELRDKTGVGMMACKKALQEKEGDLEAAGVLLREQGIAEAAKRASKPTGQGVIVSYIHTGGRIGALVEVNCETDFVARNVDFKRFLKDIAMQVCSASPAYVSREDVPAEVLERERAIYKTQAASTGKPEKILERIADGKMEKFFESVCLLDQPFNQDDSIKIRDHLNEVTAKVGENIRIRRFVRFQLGEDLEA